MPQRNSAPASTELSTVFDPAGLVSAPAILVIAAACVVLLVIGLDVRRLRRSSKLTVVHGITGIALAATVIALTVTFTAGLAQVPAASASDDPTPAELETETDPLEGFQLPTLSDD
jgi:tellurite resistance protein TehA-like permease